MISSYKKGDDFEEKMFLSLKQQVEAGEFFAKPECCRVHRKKGYYSRDRDSKIVFDISVEIFVPGQANYSILVLIECKDYTSSVPVDDVEEFWAKMQQVEASKGILASTSELQSGAFEFAKSKKLGFLRYCDNSKLKWVLRRSPSALVVKDLELTQSDIRTVLTQQSYSSAYYDCYCYIGGIFTCSTNTLFEQLCIADNPEIDAETAVQICAPRSEKKAVVPFVRKEELERLATVRLQEVSYYDGTVDLDEICKGAFQEKGLVVEYGLEPEGASGLLATITFNPAKITLMRQSDSNIGRERFTLAHELAHFFLGHGEFMDREYTQETDFDSASVAGLEIKDIRRMEFQANYFASCLLLPKSVFTREFLLIAHKLNLYDKGFGVLFVDDQPVNQQNYYYATGMLKTKFKVSRQVVENRLSDFGYLNDRRYRMTRLGLRRVGGPRAI
jgi:Zn-dependent peptidase ImmA (M78 family)